MNTMKSITLWVMLIFGTLNLVAQSQLSGVVMEETEKGVFSPLIGANVFWLGTTIGVSTDTNGVFQIPEVDGNNQLVISYIGYDADTLTITQREKLTVILKNAWSMDEVEIVYRQKSTSLSFMDPLHTEVMKEKELFKAACCNLSESFETNASVDVSFTDAVSGTKQIEMLGLSGIYTQTMRENMPSVRGLASISGLTYIPGAWMNSVSITKGTGSVLNGYESITGQINVDLKQPTDKEKFYLNLYGNRAGKVEGNVDYSMKVNDRWSTNLLIHARTLERRNDNNDDGFLDIPLNKTFIGMNRWKYTGNAPLRGQFGVKAVYVETNGGQVDYDFDRGREDQPYWGMEMNTQRLEGYAKIGYVFPEKKYQSIGFQLTGLYHEQDGYFGRRDYRGKEESFYANLIYQTIIDNTKHKIKTGASFLYDDFDETLVDANYYRTEIVPGAFVEYTYSTLEKLTLVAGLRGDYHNLFGAFVTPRMHARYAITNKTIMRISAGSGQRTANVIAENSGALASSRSFDIRGARPEAFGLDPERAYNAGISVTQNFRLDYRDGSIVLDFYRTQFENQVVMDWDDSPQSALFYNLDGRSFANSFQAEVNYELLRRLDLRLAYRFYDVQVEYTTGLRQKPLVARHRGFANIAYETRKNKKFAQWRFDFTTQLIGQKRLPDTYTNPEPYQRGEYSPSFVLLSGQVTRVFNERFEVYLGSENIGDFKQSNPILSSDDPYGPYFDSSMIWGPILGRMAYAGLRYKILRS